MNINEIARDIYQELDCPKSISISFLEHWIGKNLKNLSKLLSEDFKIIDNDIVGNNNIKIPIEIISIIKKMYLVYFFEIKENLSINTVINKNFFKKCDRKETNKIYKRLKKQTQEEMISLVSIYKRNKNIIWQAT